MKLLLDEMYPAAIATALRERGHDAMAVQDEDDLRELGDEALFATARDLGRVVVTENVKDFAPIEARLRAQGEHHPGLVFTSNRSFPRHRQRFIGAMVDALDKLAADDPACQDTTYWLQPTGR